MELLAVKHCRRNVPRSLLRAARMAAFASLAILAGCGADTRGNGRRASEEAGIAARAPSYPESLPPLAHLPLDPPIRITASFGEYRRSHFHAGLDFSTEQVIGRPVYAPLDGWVERVRTSGGGYGRALTLRSDDGRSILFGHLDAFEEPVASWIASVQDSSGEYEQDLPVEARRFPVRAGQQVAWSGASGAGPPHLHMEVRWGDMAYNPLRFGLSIPDPYPPVVRRVTLEPLDDASYVGRSAEPRTYALGERSDTVVVEGRVRAWLEAADGVSDAWPRLAPRALRMDWNGNSVECSFDRVRWDDDMTAAEWVYDATSRACPARAVALWAAAEYRPMVDRAEGSGEIGVIQVAPGDPPRVLTLAAGDAGGNWTERRLVLRPPSDAERGPGIVAGPRRRRAARPGFELVPVAGPYVRVSYGSAPAGARDVTIGWGDAGAPRPASFDGVRWTAVLRVTPGAQRIVASGPTPSPWQASVAQRVILAPRDSSLRLDEHPLSGASSRPAFVWELPRGAMFGNGVMVLDSMGAVPSSPGLEALGSALRIGSARVPLRQPAMVSLALPEPGRAHAGVYYERDRRWLWAGARASEGGRMLSADIRALGRYALFADVAAPRVGLARTARQTRGALHGRWSVRCPVIERGSGIDLEQSYFTVDGRRVPSEWEGERAVLRWRPLTPPAAGAHHYEVTATDHAGNIGRQSGTFVVR